MDRRAGVRVEEEEKRRGKEERAVKAYAAHVRDESQSVPSCFGLREADSFGAASV